jgi:hypothetical protein
MGDRCARCPRSSREKSTADQSGFTAMPYTALGYLSLSASTTVAESAKKNV